MQYRLDETQFSSEFPNFINVAQGEPLFSWTSATIPAGNTENYILSAPVTLLANATFNDVYIYSPVFDQKVKITDNYSIDPIWSYVSTELVQNQVIFTSNTVTLTITVFNGTGASITVPAFSYRLETISYAIPW